VAVVAVIAEEADADVVTTVEAEGDVETTADAVGSSRMPIGIGTIIATTTAEAVGMAAARFSRSPTTTIIIPERAAKLMHRPCVAVSRRGPRGEGRRCFAINSSWRGMCFCHWQLLENVFSA
jgi:hypothetical protein